MIGISDGLYQLYPIVSSFSKVFPCQEVMGRINYAYFFKNFLFE